MQWETEAQTCGCEEFATLVCGHDLRPAGGDEEDYLLLERECLLPHIPTAAAPSSVCPEQSIESIRELMLNTDLSKVPGSWGPRGPIQSLRDLGGRVETIEDGLSVDLPDWTYTFKLYQSESTEGSYLFIVNDEAKEGTYHTVELVRVGCDGSEARGVRAEFRVRACNGRR